MGGNRLQALPKMVEPGEFIDISVDLEAPNVPGDYQGLWMLRDQGDELFALGKDAALPFWVSISVVNFRTSDYAFDLALDYCAATWQSESGQLTCPGFIDSTDGFVYLLPNAELENRREDEPTLWVHPTELRDGWIEGTYPAYLVQSEDHFKAWVGCLGGYKRCDMDFYLDALHSDGKIYRLGKWSEKYDDEMTQIDIDLSDFVGDSLRFILGAKANSENAEAAQGFWFVPRIE